MAKSHMEMNSIPINCKNSKYFDIIHEKLRKVCNTTSNYAVSKI